MIKLAQIILSLFIIGLVLIQAKGTGLGTAFGGQNQIYHTKKGIERVVFYLTIILIVFLVILSLLNLKI